MNDNLTSKQKKFCDEYIKSGNASKAYVEAGYSMKSNKAIASEASKLLRKPSIKSYIATKMKEIESHKIADAKEVLEFYTRVLRGEETEEVPMATADRVVTITKKPSIKDKVTASKEIMKRYPLFDPMEKQRLEKLVADTRISKLKAKAMEDNGQDIELLLDKMLDTLTKEDKKNGNN